MACVPFLISLRLKMTGYSELGRKEGSVLPSSIISQSLYTWILLFRVHTHGIYVYMHIYIIFFIYIYIFAHNPNSCEKK